MFHVTELSMKFKTTVLYFSNIKEFLKVITFSKLALWLHLINMIRRIESLSLLSSILLMIKVEFFVTSVHVYQVTRSRHIQKNNKEILFC